MYERYTNKYGLDGLGLELTAPRDWKDDEAYDYHLFYPGHAYADALAADI